MEDYFIFGEKELARMGVVCSACGTEVIFDLTKDQTANQSRQCPGCDAVLLASYRTEARQDYNWITYYKKARDTQKKEAVLRFYFDKQGITRASQPGC